MYDFIFIKPLKNQISQYGSTSDFYDVDKFFENVKKGETDF